MEKLRSRLMQYLLRLEGGQDAKLHPSPVLLTQCNAWTLSTKADEKPHQQVDSCLSWVLKPVDKIKDAGDFFFVAAVKWLFFTFGFLI